MPPSSFRARFAKARRHDAGTTTRRFANFTTDTSLSSEENLINLSEYIETLIGDAAVRLWSAKNQIFDYSRDGDFRCSGKSEFEINLCLKL